MGPIDFLIEQLIIPMLSFSYHSIFPNYGVAIIVVTLIIKVLFYPLTKKQFESMKATQKIQPEMKKLQEKYKQQPEKMHKEMMKLWKENNANPLGGCLPALVQLPFFIAIFYTVKSDAFNVLLSAPGVFQGFLPFWAANLTTPDTTYVLPLIVGVTTYFSQKLMTVDSKQATLMAVMPFVMFFICLQMPSGVLLYWASSQLVSLIQQYIVLKPKTELVNVKESNDE